MDHRDMENLCYLNIFQICQGNYEIEESKRQSKETFMCISNKSKLKLNKLGIFIKKIS